MTDEVLSEIEHRNKKNEADGVSKLYSDVSTMHHFGMSPTEWGNTSRIDKKILSYQRLLAIHYEASAHERIKAKAKVEREKKELQAKAMGKMPRLAR